MGRPTKYHTLEERKDARSISNKATYARSRETVQQSQKNYMSTTHSKGSFLLPEGDYLSSVLSQDLASAILRIRREHAKLKLPRLQDRRVTWNRRVWIAQYMDARWKFDVTALDLLRVHLRAILSWIDDVIAMDMEGTDSVTMRDMWKELWDMGASLQWAYSTLEVFDTDVLQLATQVSD